MATVFKRGEVWVAQWYQPGGKRVKRNTGCTKKREAKRIADEMEAKDRKKTKAADDIARQFQIILDRAAADANSGKLTLARAQEHLQELQRAADPSFRVVSLADHLREWCQSQDARVSPSTSAGYFDMKNQFLAAFPSTVGKAPVGDLTRAQVEAAFHKLAKAITRTTKKPIKAATVNHHLRALRRALSAAVASGLAHSNPAATVKTLPETDSTEKAPFTLAEVRAMIAHPKTSEEWRGAIIIGAQTGLRMGDIVALTSGHIEEGRIVIRPHKTKRSRKTIVIPLSPACLEWIGKRKGALFPELSALPASTRSTYFARIMQKAGIPREITIAGDVTAQRSFHSLRHTFTSWLADAATPADVRQKLTGHSSPGVHGRYTHHDAALDSAIESLPQL